ncbi:tRNA (adenosine(37)-N6)-threonylcarbamoyltransferase complex dimerization subunit type 1 TsaB [Staphylococcus delphini]|uniref:tRNA (adenosine(37)-N6)-threonylcarbamoyltransferase complex dimerization subunit type 1 TsaB n=1 Tax=Staphylococcus delphini TaxID=53344 RepID=UPI0023B22956|nr:tRNA (adenosine(37)-N6)-threonylcarbamoyltransferase complex dimerization subunit type 1 TsaB [Staphylococcus delphini]MDE9752459.1 tRNA (adenosine(37)-N6)-threonylcarbamoyltransferase complex dimerization subunit type 1 TsaB [Staphylococcus delphini]MDE9789479.1 tRNA (adenosine(37)-N6)-threonylcarbamoyltransferase complex dimerization subunit type 1 TsaB [Staphylococcus delphini]MDE9791773.1 tRNA (adenosine(37)-N6)-threonylcarbamoyltransferase complex dimerization subunit type 1 TsaB [Staphy
MYSLLIDSANQPLSVAIMQEGHVLITHTTTIKRNHSVQLMPLIEWLLQQARLKPKDLDEIIVTEGPGSYTGLRIGVTTAKTLAYTLNIQLYGVSSLKAIAAQIQNSDAYIIPIINARRQHVYAGVYQWQQGELVNVMADQYMPLDMLIDQWVTHDNVIFVGEDVTQFETELASYKRITALPRADQMYPHKGEPRDIHTFTPQYLKLSEAEQNWLNQQK